MKNTMKAMKMSEQELSMVSGGVWSKNEVNSIIDECIRSEDRSCIRDGIKVKMDFNDPISENHRDVLVGFLHYADEDTKGLPSGEIGGIIAYNGLITTYSKV